MSHLKSNSIQTIISHSWVIGLLMFFVSSQAKGQMIKPLENGLEDTIFSITGDGNDIYAVTHKFTNHQKTDSVCIAKFNGVFWAYYPVFGIVTEPIQKAFIEIIGDKIYVGGFYFRMIDSTETNFAVFENNQWESLTIGRPTSKITGVVKFNNTLYATGVFNKVPVLGGRIDTCFLELRPNKTWKFLAYTHQDAFVNLITNNNKLFVYGSFNHLNGILKYHKLIEFKDSNFIPIQNDFKYVRYAYQGKNSIFLRGKDTLGNPSLSRLIPSTSYKFRNLQRFLPNFQFTDISSGFIRNGEEYFAGLFYAADSSPYANYLKVTDSSISPIYNTKQRIPIFFVKEINGYNYAYGDFDSINESRLNNIGVMGNYSSVSGTVFNDENNNCIQESNEKGLPNQYIEIIPGRKIAITDQLGHYYMELDSGSHVINLIAPNYFKQNCPSSPKAFQINLGAKQQLNNLDFGVQPYAQIEDVRLTISANSGKKALHGYREHYTLTAQNVGTTTLNNIFVLLEYDKRLSNFKQDRTIIYDSNLTKEWKINRLAVGQTYSIHFSFLIDTATLEYKDNITFAAKVDSNRFVIKDSNPKDNKDYLKQIVTSAIDPNDKQCFPSGDILASLEEIDYTIRFQNTGSSQAINVHIIDTFDNSLPLTSVSLTYKSHNPLSFKQGATNNVLIFSFNGINLPDSHTNEPLSHGQLRFKAKIKSGLAIGTQIQNKAYIYFDYQKPVITNQTMNRIVEGVNINEVEKFALLHELNFFPNPSNGKITLISKSNRLLNFQIYTTLGKIIFEDKIVPNGMKDIQLNNLSPGIYLIKTEKEIQKLIIR